MKGYVTPPSQWKVVGSPAEAGTYWIEYEHADGRRCFRAARFKNQRLLAYGDGYAQAGEYVEDGPDGKPIHRIGAHGDRVASESEFPQALTGD